MLYNGRLLALEKPRALQQSLAGRLLSVRVARPRQARGELERQPEVRWAAVFGDRVHAAVDDATTAAPVLESALTAAGFPDARLSEQPPSMEDVFMDRTARVTSERMDGS